jgi:hypothetical protein
MGQGGAGGIVGVLAVREATEPAIKGERYAEALFESVLQGIEPPRRLISHGVMNTVTR